MAIHDDSKKELTERFKHDVNVFGDCEKTLTELKYKRIFTIIHSINENKFGIGEMCDEYFFTELTREMCMDLSELFAKIAERIKD